MAFCSKCGASLPDDANVCPNCGNIVNGAPQRAAGNKASAAKKALNSDKLFNSVATIFVAVAFLFAAVAILYGFIDGIVDGADAGKNGFEFFVSDFFAGLRRSLGYVLDAIFVMFLKKRFIK